MCGTECNGDALIGKGCEYHFVNVVFIGPRMALRGQVIQFLLPLADGLKREIMDQFHSVDRIV